MDHYAVTYFGVLERLSTTLTVLSGWLLHCTLRGVYTSAMEGIRFYCIKQKTSCSNIVHMGRALVVSN